MFEEVAVARSFAQVLAASRTQRRRARRLRKALSCVHTLSICAELLSATMARPQGSGCRVPSLKDLKARVKPRKPSASQL